MSSQIAAGSVRGQRASVVLPALVVWLIFAGPSCSGDEELKGEQPSGDAAGDVADPLAFCEALFNALCAAVDACGCGDMAVADCRSYIPEACAGSIGEQVMASVTEGRVVYDRAAAARLVERLKTDTTCASLMTILDIRAGEIGSLGGVYTGTKEPGARCTVASECRAGICDIRADASEGSCVQFVGEGQTCDTGDSPFRACVDLTAGPDSDDEFQSANNALFCVPSAAGASTGTCARSLENGQTCSAHSQCASLRCTGTCQAKLALGQPCQNSSDCESSNCSEAGLTCVDKAVEGGACDNDAECQNGSCKGLYESKTCTSAALLSLGDPCIASNECASDVCSGGVCIARLCREYVNRTF